MKYGFSPRAPLWFTLLASSAISLLVLTVVDAPFWPQILVVMLAVYSIAEVALYRIGYIEMGAEAITWRYPLGGTFRVRYDEILSVDEIKVRIPPANRAAVVKVNRWKWRFLLPPLPIPLPTKRLPAPVRDVPGFLTELRSRLHDKAGSAAGR